MTACTDEIGTYHQKIALDLAGFSIDRGLDGSTDEQDRVIAIYGRNAEQKLNSAAATIYTARAAALTTRAPL